MIFSHQTRVAIVGYGNVGRGVELAIGQNPDMTLAAVFSRRDPLKVKTASGAPVYALAELASHKDDIDVAILCGGSHLDLPQQGPAVAALVNTVDSFDTHPKINDYFNAIDPVAKAAGTTSIISVGWDPGLFSLQRLYGSAVLPNSESYTFWGPGVSQGHSDALRQVTGVMTGIQYTLPVEAAIEAVRSGGQPMLTTRQKHTRDCYVVAAEGADRAQIEHDIVTMPDYFADYDTTVTFVSAEEFESEHRNMPHGGFVLTSGESAPGHHQLVEYRLQLDSNPEFTAGALVAYARAAHRLAQVGDHGAKTVYDVAPGLLSPLEPSELRAKQL